MADDESNSDEQAQDEQDETEAKDESTSDTKAESGSESESESEDGESDPEENVERSENDDPDFGAKEDEPANETQMKYLRPLAEKLDEDIPDDMSEADAAAKINEFQDNAAG
jgi:hypothetical protein